MDINITFPGGKKVNAEFSDMVVKTDQSILSGGEGSAPEPFRLFLASIGTCAGIYILGFCSSRGIPTEGLSLVQHVEYQTNEKGAPTLSNINIDIIVPPGFPEKYQEALIRVADKCAVKNAIFNPPAFDIKVIV